MEILGGHVLPGQHAKRLPPQTVCALRFPRSSDPHWSCDLADLLARRLDGSIDHRFGEPSVLPTPIPTSIERARRLAPGRGLQFRLLYVQCVYHMAVTADPDDETRRPKSGRLGLRTDEWQRSILAAASRAEGSTISEFVLKYATRAAEEVLADRRAFVLSEPQWAAFTEALDRPPRSMLRLQNLMETAATSTGASE